MLETNEPQPTPRRAFLAAVAGLAGAAAIPGGPGSAAGAAAATPAGPTAPPAAAPRPVRLLSTYVAGAAYHAAPAVAGRLRPGDELVLRRRPDSGYDPRSVEVRTVDGALLGHVPRADNQALAALMDAGVPAAARVYAADPDPVRPEVRFAVEVWLTA